MVKEKGDFMVLIRCSKCRRYYSIKNSACKCGHTDKKRTYVVRIDNKDYQAGKSLANALEIDAQIKREKRFVNMNVLAQKERITFKQFHDSYYQLHYSTLRSANRIKHIMDYFVKTFKNQYLDQITPASVEKAVLEISVDKAPRTHDYYISIIKRIFNYAIELEFIDRNPVKIKQLKIDNARDRYLTQDEEKRLLEACKQSKNPHLFPIVAFALLTGMRAGEIRNFNPETDIRDGKIYIKGHSTKSKKRKIIPINTTLAYILNNYRIDFNQNVKKSFGTAIKRAKIKDFVFHDLRHTFASRLVQSQTDLYTVSQLLGHSDIKMTQRYSHLNPEGLIKEVEKLSWPFLDGEGFGATSQRDIEPRRLDLLPDEEKRLLDACKASTSNALYPMAMLVLHTGMRQAQMERLKPRNFKGKYIELDGKRYLLNDELQKVFQEYPPKNISFTTNILTAFKTALEKAGLPKMMFYELRYTYEAKKAK